MTIGTSSSVFRSPPRKRQILARPQWRSLTPEEKPEKEARKACKAKICDIIATRDYVVEVTMSPKVKFKDGKATEATVNWGPASAPILIYPLIYAGTGLDNSTNVLGPEVVRLVNGFATKKCAELKAELPAGKPN